MELYDQKMDDYRCMAEYAFLTLLENWLKLALLRNTSPYKRARLCNIDIFRDRMTASDFKK